MKRRALFTILHRSIMLHLTYTYYPTDVTASPSYVQRIYITLGGVIEIILIVSTSVTDQNE
jgi:hypothetical protein